jgi:hypothetical protein
MLSNLERLFFVILVAISMGLAWVTFRRMFKVIGRGSSPIDWAKALANWPKGLSVFISQKTLFKTRPIIGAIHAGVAWGFTLYLLVNVIDVFYGMIPGFYFLPDNIIGDIYRVFVDIFSMVVLLGVLLFIVRRFITKDERLVTNEPVLLSDSARKGIKRDSLIVGVLFFM